MQRTDAVQDVVITDAENARQIITRLTAYYRVQRDGLMQRQRDLEQLENEGRQIQQMDAEWREEVNRIMTDQQADTHHQLYPISTQVEVQAEQVVALREQLAVEYTELERRERELEDMIVENDRGREELTVLREAMRITAAEE